MSGGLNRPPDKPVSRDWSRDQPPKHRTKNRHRHRQQHFADQKWDHRPDPHGDNVNHFVTEMVFLWLFSHFHLHRKPPCSCSSKEIWRYYTPTQIICQVHDNYPNGGETSIRPYFRPSFRSVKMGSRLPARMRSMPCQDFLMRWSVIRSWRKL